MTTQQRRAALILAVGTAATILSAAGRLAPPSAADGPRSADILALLPDGEEKRSFVLDCTGCHQIDAERAFVSGRVRTAAEWETAIHRMLQMAGPSSSFPVISARVDPAALSHWLARYIDRVPDPAPRIAHPEATLREYEYPYPGDLPHDLVIGADGRVIITGMFTHRMLILNPETGHYEEKPIPIANANPRALDLDGEGRWWVLLGAPGRVAAYDPRTDEWTSYEIGTYGHSIAIDTRGKAWFNGHFTNNPARIGHVDTDGRVRFFDIETPDPLRAGAGPIPYELRVGPDGAVWMSELQGNRIVRLDPATGGVRAWTMPHTFSGPRRFDVDSSGIIWIPAYGTNQLLRFDPNTGTFEEYELPLEDAVPYVVRVDPRRGTVWIGASAGDALFSFDPVTRRFESYPLPTRGALVRHIDIHESTGDVWAAYGASPGVPAKILRLSARRISQAGTPLSHQTHDSYNPPGTYREDGCSKNGSTVSACVATRTRWRTSSTTLIRGWMRSMRPAR